MKKIASAGNRGNRVRSDCFIEIELKSSGGLSIDLKSKVAKIFGKAIRAQIEELTEFYGVKHASVYMEDSGALPFVIYARLECAIQQLIQSEKEFLPDIIPENLSISSRERLRQSRLYLPGNTPSMMINAGIHEPNGIILDLEDSVAPSKKDEARFLVRNALCQVNFYGAERMVRINQLPLGLKDAELLSPHAVQLFLVPKCENPKEIIELEKIVQSTLKKHNIKREIYFMPIIESALGVENAFLIAGASKNVVAMAIGLEDYTADLGVARTPTGEESLYARTRMVNACKAAGIQAIDSVFSDVADMDALRMNVSISKSIGFEGMGCIHPRQIEVIHQEFQPGKEEIEKAKLIVNAFEEAQKKGLGVVALGSKMIDAPVVKRAQRIIDQINK